jgi:hypothetical protein
VWQRVVYAIVSLRYAIANVGCEVSCSATTLIGNASHHLIDKLHKVSATRMRITKGALYHNLRLCQILNRPTHTNLQGVILRGERTHSLAI